MMRPTRKATLENVLFQQHISFSFVRGFSFDQIPSPLDSGCRAKPLNIHTSLLPPMTMVSLVGSGPDHSSIGRLGHEDREAAHGAESAVMKIFDVASVVALRNNGD